MTTCLSTDAVDNVQDNRLPRQSTTDVLGFPRRVPVTVEQVQAVQRNEHSDLFLSIFERSGMCFAVLDPRLRLLELNHAFLQQFGSPLSEARGRAFGDFLHPSIRQNIMRQFARLTEGRRVRFAERVVALRPNAPAFAAELTGIAVYGENNQIKMIVVLLRPDKAREDHKVTVDSGKMLTDLDAKILEGVAAGIATVQLAAKLYLSRQGVEYHVSAMLRKFKVSNRAALVSKAYSMGIFSVGCWPPSALPEYVR
jgi:PAS domain S-box-containing protein